MELFILLIGIFMVVIYLWNTETKTNELFTDNYTLLACPTGYKPFYYKNGDNACCNGEISNNTCLGKDCSLNGGSNYCADVVLEDYKIKGKDQCPPSMPNYFESNKDHGCTQGLLNNTLTGPRTTQPTCIIYSSTNDNLFKKDSCFNQKEMDNTPCVGKDCVKKLVQSTQSPPMVAVEFTDNYGVRRLSYSKSSYTRWLDAEHPEWRGQGIDLNRNLAVLDVAKAVYIDRTMDISNIQL